MSIKFKIIDHTGDSVVHHDSFQAADKSFKSMMKEFMAYDGDTNTVINKMTPETNNVIFHRKLMGG